LVALLEQGEHALTKLSQLRGRPLATKQISVKLGLELFDRPRQRWLRNVALAGGAREVLHAGHCQEISHLMHFHDRIPRADPCWNLPASVRKAIGNCDSRYLWFRELKGISP